MGSCNSVAINNHIVKKTKPAHKQHKKINKLVKNTEVVSPAQSKDSLFDDSASEAEDDFFLLYSKKTDILYIVPKLDEIADSSIMQRRKMLRAKSSHMRKRVIIKKKLKVYKQPKMAKNQSIQSLATTCVGSTGELNSVGASLKSMRFIPIKSKSINKSDNNIEKKSKFAKNSNSY